MNKLLPNGGLELDPKTAAILVDIIAEWEEVAQLPIAPNWKRSPIARENRRESKVYGNCASELKGAIGHRLFAQLQEQVNQSE